MAVHSLHHRLTELNQVYLPNSANILVRGPHLRTKIWVHTTIGLLKKPLSICQSGLRKIQNELPLLIVESIWGPEQGYRHYFAD